MCCFTGPVKSVSGTNIFARAGENGRQFLAYSMTFDAKEDLAMVLPLPVAKGADEKAVSFIDLKEYPGFFGDLRAGFPPDMVTGHGLDSENVSTRKLEVIQVGNFEASFVPTVKDFVRLDTRFRLAPEVWDKLPGYRDYGFTVFKLKSGAMTVHP